MSNAETVRTFERTITVYKELTYKIDFINKEVELIQNDKGYYKEPLIALNNQLNKYIRFKNLIDICMNKLTEVERKVIELRYLTKEKITWKQIAKIVSFSEDYCRQGIKLRAINKIMSTINESGIEINKLLKG
ncbi:probable sigma factor [Clostridium baratii]|uniref:sigma factor-like helix-turn-helix DNA-binding protein n=1 Tax=Clostridium baratii TaxID=1561 RepID=UPI0006C5B567|nr:sigma factor-like helix-turn-helix DNA-binding protein [Clostridium baratii]CUP24517.1 probable sigma factor [Clostridium baratii]